MTKIRTINQTIKLLRELDPETAITEKSLRRAIRDGELPYRKVGNRTLLNVDVVCQYYGCAQEK